MDFKAYGSNFEVLCSTGRQNSVAIADLSSPVLFIKFMERILGQFAEDVLKSDAVQRLVHSSDQKFDAVIHESLLHQETSAVLAQKFKALSIPILGMGDDSWANELAGLSDNPAYMVTWMSRNTDQMSFFERLYNTYTLAVTTSFKYYHLNRIEARIDRHLNYTGWQSRPPLRQLLSDNALILVNSHHSLGFSYPKAPHVKEIGGVHIQPTKPLPKHIELFLNESSDGFILFSLGSVINTDSEMVSRVKEQLMKALFSVRHRVLCKLDDESIKMPENIMVNKWLPQNDVLAHKNVKLFISHGGLQSAFEALHHGVPMLLLPFFTDQFRNAKLVEKAGFGITLDVSTVDHTSIYLSIEELLTNSLYKEKAMQQSRLLKDRPMNLLNESIYWIEYVLKHGRVLQPSSVHLSFIQLNLLDVLAAVLLSIVSLYCVIGQLFCMIGSLVRLIKRDQSSLLKEEKREMVQTQPKKKRKFH